MLSQTASFKPSDLHVIAVVHNPLRFKSRHELFRRFVKQCRDAGVTLHVVEASFGDRVHDHTDLGLDVHTTVVQFQELWLKESLINVGFSRLPANWKYAAWVDADIEFLRDDWAIETIHQLQHYRIVQMFATAADLGPDGEIMQVFNGFGYSKAKGLPEWVSGDRPAIIDSDGYYCHTIPGQKSQGKFWHPGFAWAIRRETFDNLGGMIDWSVLGSADHMMALAWIGKIHKSVPDKLHPNYMRHALIYQERAQEHVRGDIGYVPGTIVHSFHGKKRDRGYVPRWKILQEHQYDPERDIRRDHQGLVQLTRPGERMRDDLRTYFRSRNEDSIDPE